MRRSRFPIDGVHVLRSARRGLWAAVLIALAGCSPDYSPNTYSANAVQQANKVEPAVVIGYRQVAISANGTVGAVTGGAAGGILGAQAGPTSLHSALGAVGGSAAGSIVGTAIEHVTGDTTGWEYIVRKVNGELLSVTQKEPAPLPIGQKVLVITGNQARIIPDYSLPEEPKGDKVPAATDKEPLPPAAQPAAPQPAPGQETRQMVAPPVDLRDTVPPPAEPAPKPIDIPPTPSGAPAAPQVAPQAPAEEPAASPPPPATVEEPPATPPEPPSPSEPPPAPAETTPAPEQTGAAGKEVAPTFWETFNRTIRAGRGDVPPQ
jgi:outer membrane lipoprotein SlyB